ncbi:MAG: HEPN domain-containing protein [Deltaproteobacteria bacterium]|nr:HEPN domain-containing protein [Deltaproteobacteria bacterium]MBW2342256.1 HEPN domain-containing protein [Deltaproteobacteria bacterium]
MEEATKILINVRVESADEDLETAKELLKLNRYRAAVNRAYYAIYSTTNAVLLSKHIERSKHSGVEAAFIQNFIKTGLFGIEFGKMFNYIRKKREECDYSSRIKIDRETAEKIVEDSEKFIRRMKEYLREMGAIK